MSQVKSPIKAVVAVWKAASDCIILHSNPCRLRLEEEIWPNLVAKSKWNQRTN